MLITVPGRAHSRGDRRARPDDAPALGNTDQKNNKGTDEIDIFVETDDDEE